MQQHHLRRGCLPAVLGLSLQTLFSLPSLSVRSIRYRLIMRTLSRSTFLLFLHSCAFSSTLRSFSVIPFSSPRFFSEKRTAFSYTAMDSSNLERCSSSTARLWQAMVRTSSRSVPIFWLPRISSCRSVMEKSTFSRASLWRPSCERTAQRLRQVSARVSSFLLFHSRVRASCRHWRAVLSFPVLRQQQALLLSVMARYLGLLTARESAFWRKMRVRSNLSFCRKIMATRLHSSHILMEMRSNSSLSAPKQLRLNSRIYWYLSSAQRYFASRCSCSPWLSSAYIRSRIVGSIENYIQVIY